MSEKLAAIPFVCGACCCFGIVFAVTLTLSLNYGTLKDRALDYNEANPGLDDYDKCGGVFGEGSIETTNWTQIYKYNFIVNLIMACWAAAAMLCVPCGPATMCATACLNCTALPVFVGIVLTGIRLLGDKGDVCTANTVPYNTAEDLSFASDAETMRKLWITQIVFHIPISCFMVCGTMASVGVMKTLGGSFMRMK